jgi:hypothetical protein
MKDAGRIIHRTVWIDYDREALLTKTGTDAVSKARADKKQPLTGFNPKPGILNINHCPELHQL